jgi:1-acyl-sn-glycerol-3-phosphate acyltransferase
VADRPTFVGRRWYDFGYWACFTAFKFGFSIRWRGYGNVPRSGPLLFLSNHQSMLDPVLVGLAVPRYLTYLARSNLFTQRGLAPLIRSLGAIPIDRNMGKDGLQLVLNGLDEGRAVLMFPEGERTHDGTVQPLKPGVSLLIKRVTCPIIPVGIAGAYGAWSRHMKWPRPSPLLLPPGPSTLAVSIGEPIPPTRFSGLKREEMLTDLHAAIAAQQEEAERFRRK